jgi:hypothetical protein
VSASGSSTDASNATTSLTPASESVAISAPTNPQCGATLTGAATLTGTAVPVSGATVSLLDSSGNPVLDGQGNAVTTTTAADGSYSFGFLFPGRRPITRPRHRWRRRHPLWRSGRMVW